jgi:hypothetical protein
MNKFSLTNQLLTSARRHSCGGVVAVDAYGYERLMERDLAELTYLHKAHDRGLGNKNWKDTLYKEVTA